MTSRLEYEAKNLEQAIERACDALALSKDEIDFDVISRGSSGIFGLAGVKKAKIRVKLPEGRTQASSLLDRIDQELSGAETAGAASSRRPPAADSPAVIAEDGQPKHLGQSVLEHIVRTISNDARVAVNETGERLQFDVRGGDAAILIGKRGQTLEAIQTLVEKIVNKHSAGNGKIRVMVDVEGYLQARQENLEKLAVKLAAKSKRIGKPIVLSQMSAYERRVIHLSLKDHPGVRTKSRGEGYLRQLVIFPQKPVN